jgi:DNA mismatch repair protein MutS
LPHVANVHLDAVEHKDRIVFLHRLEGGPADRSYGIHVAHLAGIPKDVVRAARRHLAELEKQLRAGGPQPDLFAQGNAVEAPGESNAALEALLALKPDEMSPKEALEALYRLKKLAEE